MPTEYVRNINTWVTLCSCIKIYWPGSCSNHLSAYVCYLGYIQCAFQTSHQIFWCVSLPVLVSALNAGICLEMDHSSYRCKWCPSFRVSFKLCSRLCVFKQDCKAMAHTTGYGVFTFWICTQMLCSWLSLHQWLHPEHSTLLLHQVEYPHHFHCVGLLHTHTVLLQEETEYLLWKTLTCTTNSSASW